MFQQPNQQQSNVDPVPQEEQVEEKQSENTEAPASSFGTVSAAALNVRQGPSGQTSKLGQLSQGASVTITGSQGVWQQITYNGEVGWVHGNYVDVAAAPSTEHTVAAGETLWVIARDRLGDGNLWQQIASLNNIANPSKIGVGDTLRLPAGSVQKPGEGASTDGAGGGKSAEDDAAAAPAPVEHTVVSGDNLSKIAQRYLGDANRWQEIATLNNISNPSSISVGDKLRLPSGATQTNSGATTQVGGGGTGGTTVSASQVAQDIANPAALATAVNAALGVVAASTKDRASDHVPIIMAQAARSGITVPNQVAYLLATAEHESGFGNEKYSRSESLIEDHNPIKGSAGAYYAKVHAGRGGTVYGETKEEVVTKYWDRAYGHKLGNNDGTSDGANYRGRGYVQLTGRDNYKKMSDHLNAAGFKYELDGTTWGGQGTPIDLVNNYTHVNLSKELAAAVMIEGSKEGMFTTRSLDNYITDDKTDYTNARRVINGTDRAADIAGIARRYQGAVSGLWAPVFVPDPNAKSEDGGQGPEAPPATADVQAGVTPAAATEVEKESTGQAPTGTEVQPESEKSDEPTVSIPEDIQAPANANEPQTEPEAPVNTGTTAPAAPVVAGEVATVNSATLNVRLDPNTSRASVGQLGSGDVISIIEHSGLWGKIMFQGQEAWIHKNFVTLGASEGPAMAGREVQTQYREWLIARVAEVGGLEGQDQFNRASGLLWQAELHAHQVRHGEVVNIETLNTAPLVGEAISSGAVPPEWIAPLRELITMVETSDTAGGESDWNSRLGVPQYRTQSDNLVSPEATCATTSLAMAVERLGLSREQVVAGLDRQLGVADAQPQQRNQVWVSRAGPFLAAENNRGSNYQKLRGRPAGPQQRGVYAASLRENGQMEDLLAFMAFELGISRFAITSSVANLRAMLTAIDSDTAAGVRTSKLGATDAANWNSFSSQIATCVNNGGSAIFSLFHKGQRSGTHIMSIQRVVEDGLIVDDPYGQMRADYRVGNGDAYAARGDYSPRQRITNNKKDTDGDAYHADAAQDLAANESKGDSYKVSRALVQSAINYVTLASQREA